MQLVRMRFKGHRNQYGVTGRHGKKVVATLIPEWVMCTYDCTEKIEQTSRLRHALVALTSHLYSNTN